MSARPSYTTLAAERDIWLNAKGLVDAFGDQAVDECSNAIHDFALEGDDDEAQKWFETKEAAKRLLDDPALIALVEALEASPSGKPQ